MKKKELIIMTVLATVLAVPSHLVLQAYVSPDEYYSNFDEMLAETETALSSSSASSSSIVSPLSVSSSSSTSSIASSVTTTTTDTDGGGSLTGPDVFVASSTSSVAGTGAVSSSVSSNMAPADDFFADFFDETSVSSAASSTSLASSADTTDLFPAPNTSASSVVASLTRSSETTRTFYRDGRVIPVNLQSSSSVATAAFSADSSSVMSAPGDFEDLSEEEFRQYFTNEGSGSLAASQSSVATEAGTGNLVDTTEESPEELVEATTHAAAERSMMQSVMSAGIYAFPIIVIIVAAGAYFFLFRKKSSDIAPTRAQLALEKEGIQIAGKNSGTVAPPTPPESTDPPSSSEGIPPPTSP